MLQPIRDSLLWSSIRATPFIYFFYIAMNAFIYSNYNTIYFLLAYSTVFMSNGIFKNISKLIYNYFDVDYIFPFGQGSRPKGCTNSGTFLKLSNPVAITFGMPSGHSQLAWFFSIYLILSLLHNEFNSNNKYIYIKIIILIFLALLVSYSRIYIDNCHTLGQVIIGGFIGIIMAYLLFKLKLYLSDSLLKNIV